MWTVALETRQIGNHYSAMALVEAVERHEWAGLRRRRETRRVVDFESLALVALWEWVRWLEDGPVV